MTRRRDQSGSSALFFHLAAFNVHLQQQSWACGRPLIASGMRIIGADHVWAVLRGSAVNSRPRWRTGAGAFGADSGVVILRSEPGLHKAMLFREALVFGS